MCERFRNHRALPPLPSEKLLQCSFWRFVDTQPIVWPRFRTHFADILNSTTTNNKRWSYPDTLISESMVSFADSPFKFLLLPPLRFLDPWRYCMSFVGISRQKQHLRPLQEELSLYWSNGNYFSHILRSNLPTPEKRPKVHFALFFKTKISTNEAHVSSSFTASFHPFSLKFGKNTAR